MPTHKQLTLGPNVPRSSVTIDHGCTSKDAYGSNDCELDWGSDYKITLNGTIKKDLNQGEFHCLCEMFSHLESFAWDAVVE